MPGKETSHPSEVIAPVADHVPDMLAGLQAQDVRIGEPLEEGLDVLGPHERVGPRVDDQASFSIPTDDTSQLPLAGTCPAEDRDVDPAQVDFRSIHSTTLASRFCPESREACWIPVGLVTFTSVRYPPITSSPTK